MKNQIFKHGIALILGLALSTVVNGQESKNFKITPELSKIVIDEDYLKDIKIYHLSPKVVDRYFYNESNVETDNYKNLSKELAKYKKEFDMIENKAKRIDSITSTQKTIIDNITIYLENKDKQLLANTQKLIDEYPFKTSVPKNDSFAQYTNDLLKNVKTIKLWSNDKLASKSDLISFSKILNDDWTNLSKLSGDIRKNHEYISRKETLSKLSESLSNTERYERGLVLSEKLKKDTIYMKDEVEIDINSFSGEFSSYLDDYCVIIEKEVPNMVMKNQAISPKSNYYDENTMYNLKKYYLLESSTGELYCLNDQMYILSLQSKQDKEQKQKEYNSIGKSVAYKEWKTKYKSVIQSCSTNINACEAIKMKYRYKNIYNQWVCLTNNFSNADKTVFKKNIASLEAKVHELSKMEDNKAFNDYYYDHTSTEEHLKSATISDYLNSNRVY